VGERVTVGVPVYKGQDYVHQALQSIQAQTHADLEVLISIDGADPVCEDLCRPFLSDPRFQVTVQPERLGWVDNINWLIAHAQGDYWYFHQQDDLTEPTYVEALVEAMRRNPAAALVYSDLVPMGRITEPFEQPASVTGATPFLRQLTMLHEQYPAFAFRGLTRREALRAAGPIPRNDIKDFAADISWLAAVALSGELLHVPLPLYRKRYHDQNTESGWWAWGRETRLHAWSRHTVNMLEQALRVDGSAEELRLLFIAAVERLTSPRAARFFLPVHELTASERSALLDEFLAYARASRVHDIPVLLDMSWRDIEEMSRAFRWVPKESMVDIVALGPGRMPRGVPFNVQPDGSSALWVRLSRRAAPGWRLQLGGTLLETTHRGAVLTARVPLQVIAAAGELDLLIVGLDGRPRSKAVTLSVTAT
jgi:GT2 family glycosyltransferase